MPWHDIIMLFQTIELNILSRALQIEATTRLFLSLSLTLNSSSNEHRIFTGGTVGDWLRVRHKTMPPNAFSKQTLIAGQHISRLKLLTN